MSGESKKRAMNLQKKHSDLEDVKENSFAGSDDITRSNLDKLNSYERLE